VDDCQAYRADTTLGFVQAAHALVTNYKYNSQQNLRNRISCVLYQQGNVKISELEN